MFDTKRTKTNPAQMPYRQYGDGDQQRNQKRVANKATASLAAMARHRKPQRADRAGEQPGGGGKQIAAPCTTGIDRYKQGPNTIHPGQGTREIWMKASSEESAVTRQHDGNKKQVCTQSQCRQ